MRDLWYILLGYLAGSILFARVCGALIGRTDVTKNSTDGNPGTANAFRAGGFWCGALTLVGDVGKGFFPVYLYTRGEVTAALALVLAAPVLGHVFPLFFNFRGGKGIATTFGCLLGLLPDYRPLALLAVLFIFFSVGVRISPHYYRTLVTYLCVEVGLFVFAAAPAVLVGFSLICGAVLFRLLTSKEERAPFEVRPLWMR